MRFPVDITTQMSLSRGNIKHESALRSGVHDHLVRPFFGCHKRESLRTGSALLLTGGITHGGYKPRSVAGFEARQILHWLLKAIIAITTARRCPMLAWRESGCGQD
jgi:hypothetical protein